jgi:hypothetical protein
LTMPGMRTLRFLFVVGRGRCADFALFICWGGDDALTLRLLNNNLHHQLTYSHILHSFTTEPRG